MSNGVCVIAEAVAEELTTEHCGFFSDKKKPSSSARSTGLGGSSPTHGARLMLDRRCLVEVPNAPRHRAERAHAEADYDKETALVCALE